MKKIKNRKWIVILVMIVIIGNAWKVKADEDNESPWIQSVEAEDGSELLNGNGGLGKEYEDSLRIVVYVSDSGGSGISQIKFYTVNEGVAGSENTMAVNENLTAQIVINGKFQGSLFIKAIDNAGNQGDYVCVSNICIKVKENEKADENEEGLDQQEDKEEKVENQEEQGSDNNEDSDKKNQEDPVNENNKETEEDSVTESNEADDKKMQEAPLTESHEENNQKTQIESVPDKYEGNDKKTKADPVIDNNKEQEVQLPERTEVKMNLIKEKFQKTMKEELDKMHAGSVFRLGENLERCINKYIYELPEFIIYEENADEILNDTISLRIHRNGLYYDLQENKDFEVIFNKENDTNKYEYIINEDVFSEDGMYEISLTDNDTFGNKNTLQERVGFVLDRQAPVIENINVTDNYVCDGASLMVKALVKDNLNIEDIKVYVDDMPVKYTFNDELIEFEIEESGRKRNIEIIASDMAGNMESKETKGIIVSENRWIRLFYNRWKMAGITMIIAGITGSIVLYILKQKNKSFDKAY